MVNPAAEDTKAPLGLVHKYSVGGSPSIASHTKVAVVPLTTGSEGMMLATIVGGTGKKNVIVGMAAHVTWQNS